MKILRKTVLFFDKLEDSIRAYMSHRPIRYALIGGTGIVLFWKGVWETAEYIPALYGPGSMLVGLLLLLPTGLFVSFFIGDNIILSGYKKEKKLAERTETSVRVEMDILAEISRRLNILEQTIQNMNRKPQD